jgi:hypothetical protein
MKYDERLYRQHWLYRWIDEEGIKTPGNYIKAIRKRGSFDRIREISHQVYSGPSSQRGNASTSVLASRRLDFSGAVSCPDFGCVQPVVDRLFSRVWHYFDTVVVDEEPLDHILFSGDDINDLLQHVHLFLYLRNIGAEKYLEFTPKVSALCSDHFRQHAQERHLDLDIIFDQQFEQDVVDTLTSLGDFHTWFDEFTGWQYDIRHPTFGQLTGGIDHSNEQHRPSNEDAARTAFGKSCTALISDVSASRALGLPLFDTASDSWTSESLQNDAPNDHIVALSMNLPVLSNVPIKEVLRYRDDNRASFEKFRSALRSAITEQIEETGSDSPQAIADKVVATRVQPELADLETKLVGIKKTLARKIGANVAVTGAAVSVGAIENVPLIIAATAAASATSVYQTVNKSIDSKRKAVESGWYFLWKLQRKHRH